ncbi:MAG: DUF5691 domain-containing protein [Pseudomonadota bacterium]|nr:DUF5691 domain-containing protein [Pseudomonadota bacterium]
MLEDYSHYENDIQKAQALTQHWLTGNGPLTHQHLPQSWQAVLQDVPEPAISRAALALWSQQQSLLQMQVPALKPTGLQRKPDLQMTCIPAALRFQFQQCMAEHPYDHAIQALIIRLTAQYGYMPHLDDWCPVALESEVTSTFLPFQLWLFESSAGAQVFKSPSDAAVYLTTLTQRKRVLYLQKKRQVEPCTARAYIEALFAQATPAQKVDYLHVLAVHISEKDQGFLEQALVDKSWKVQQVGFNLLQRLDQDIALEQVHKTISSSINTLVERLTFVEQANGHRAIAFKDNLKNKNESEDILQAFVATRLASLAQALELSLCDFIRAWSFELNTHQSNHPFVENIVKNAPVAAVQTLLDCLYPYVSNNKPYGIDLITLCLRYRAPLVDMKQVQIALALHQDDNIYLSTFTSVEHVELYSMLIEDLDVHQAFQQLLLAFQNTTKKDRIGAEYQARRFIRTFAFFGTKALAITALELLADLDIGDAQSEINVLRFKIALSEKVEQ